MGSVVATAHRIDAVDEVLLKAMVLAPVPKEEAPPTKTRWLRRLQEYEDEDEEDVSIRASHHRLALDEQEMETNRRLGALPPHAPASSSWEGAAPMLALGEGSEGAVPPLTAGARSRWKSVDGVPTES